MSNLAPGDLCEIIEAESGFWMSHNECVGSLVVLIRIGNPRGAMYPDLYPFWKCAGVPPGFLISHRCLRKIPPPPLEMEPREEESVV
jgi:hypothetical protein